jgi:O-antigen/teichoic acid export membrane protein
MIPRGFFVLLTGAGAAQLITIALLPVLSRLYDAAAFGQAGAVMAVVSIAAVLVHGRYHMAISVADTDEDAEALLGLSILLVVVMSLPITALAIALSRSQTDRLGFFLALGCAFVMTVLTALFDIAAYWRSRKGRFNASARNGLVRSVATGACQLSLAPVGGFGLITGTVFGAIVAAVILVVELAREGRPSIPNVGRVLKMANLHRGFPLYGVPQGWLAAMSWNAMPLLLSRFAGIAEAGQYWVAYRVLVAPVALFNAAYRQSALPQLARFDLATASRLAIRHTAMIGFAGFLPTLIIHLFGPQIFSFIMGTNWHVAGNIAAWMSLGILADFFKVPMQTLMQVRGQQQQMLIWEGAILLARYSLIIPFLIRGESLNAVAAFSCIGFAGWLLFVLVQWGARYEKGLI